MERRKLIKRKTRIRSKISGTDKRPRLNIYRSNKALFAQIINDTKAQTIVGISASKLTKSEVKGANKTKIAKLLGMKIAKLAKAKQIKDVVFDRGGYKYHGRIKAFAEGAREGGLNF